MNNMLSVIVTSRNERFMPQTVEDLFRNAEEDIEVIVVLEGYWPEVYPEENENLRYIHFGRPRGLRGAVNAGVAIARGKYIMKTDGHCAFGPGFDRILKADCQPHWVCVPRRYSLDAENWCRKDKHPIDYLYCETPRDENNWEINVRVWNEKNYDQELQKLLIDDIFTFQGSCWFMHRDFFYELDLMDDVNYGTFRKEPQEITFKAWCSHYDDARVIRNKKTWYAHLHKGKQYGRGYNVNRADWRKGDEYLLNWTTDSAWDKQYKPFRWMIEKFDMPEWDTFDWSKYESQLQPFMVAVNKVLPKVMHTSERKMTRVYQNIDLPGIRVQNENRKYSKFWNEGKWRNFIEPLLPKDATDMTFVEMGCNAGLFLRMAKDYGFRNVVGIEKDNTPTKVGIEYRDAYGYDYKLLKRSLGGKFHEKGSFDFDELPFTDVTLLSTWHYYIDTNSWLKYLDMLWTRTRKVIVVSRPDVSHKHWVANSDLKSLNYYFRDWILEDMVTFVDPTNDPSPRNLFSVVYSSAADIERIPLSKIDNRESQDDTMYMAMMDLANKITIGDEFDLLSTDYYEAWKKRKSGKWSERGLRKFVKGKYENMLDVKNNGLKDPIVVDYQYRLCDGGHRLAMLKAMDYKYVNVRKTI